MGEMKMRELNLEEMDKVSGGVHDREEIRREYFDYRCPYCNAAFSTHRERMQHIKNSHPEQSNE